MDTSLVALHRAEAATPREGPLVRTPEASRSLAMTLRRLLSVPFIYSLAVPFVLLDGAIWVYQAVCFPLYGIARVRRRDYFVADRARLPYLDWLGKVNCTYCSYANGLLAYATEITARTEQYWCPIRHERTPQGTHARYPRFLPYGDGDAFASRAEALRRSLVDE
jgi:hypothetical protein